MNLLPAHARQPWRRAGRAGIRGRVGTMGSVFLTGLTLAAIGLDVRSLARRLESGRTERVRLQVLATERRGLEERLLLDRDRLRQLRAEEVRLARWDEERLLLPELLRTLSAAIPDTVVLEAVRRDGADLRVTGRAGSAAAVARTLEAFVESERLHGLELLWVEHAGEAPDSAEQRFAFAGSVHYASRDPEPFDRVETLSRQGERSR